MVGKRIVIVGGGEAGVAAANAVRDADERAEIVLLSDEPDLPYERPPLSKEVLTDGALETSKSIREPAWYSDRTISLRTGAKVISIEPSSKTLKLAEAGEETEIGYDKLLLATGARARTLSSTPRGLRVFCLRSQADAQRLKRSLGQASSVLVVGGGVIGLEIASSARTLGKSVTVIEAAPRLMARAVAPEISALLHKLHTDNGIEVILNAGSVDLQESADGVRADMDRNPSVEADIAVVGIGVIPNTELAEEAGCRVANGVVVDAQGRTSVPDIYAAGDVAVFDHPIYGPGVRLESWRHAQRHGAHVGAVMAGADMAYKEVPWFWTDQHGVNLQVTGVSDPACQTYWRGDQSTGTALHFIEDRLVSVTTINNGRDMRPLTKLIAAGWRGEPSALLSDTQPLGKLCNQLLADI